GGDAADGRGKASTFGPCAASPSVSSPSAPIHLPQELAYAHIFLRSFNEIMCDQGGCEPEIQVSSSVPAFQPADRLQYFLPLERLYRPSPLAGEGGLAKRG